MAINFLTTTNTLPEIQINDAGNNPRLELQESGSVSGGISTTGGALVFEASSGIEKARILSTGQFLIGHTSYYYAGTYLQVGNTSDNQNGLQITTSTTGNAYILFGDGTGADAYTGQIRYSHTDNFMRFDTNSSTAMTIDSSQRVGIGTLSPSATLHVKPASGGNGEVNIERTSGALINLQAQSALGVIGTNSNHNLSFKTNSNVGMTLTTGGKVGIGTTSPGMMLHVKGGDEATMKLESTSGEPAIFWAPGSSSLKWEQRASASRWQLYSYDEAEWVFNIYDAKIGIGTVSPSYKVDIAGDQMRLGDSNQTTTYFRMEATNTAGAPARAVGILQKGYESRAQGIFHEDTGKSGEEWFSGIPYNATFNNWQVGYDSSSGQPEYTANAILTAYHDKSVYLNAYGSGTYTGTATTYLAVTSSGKIIETGSGGVLPGGPYLPLAGGTMTGNTLHGDNVQISFGASNDLNIKHDGSNSKIENYTGHLNIIQEAADKDINFYSDDGSGGTEIYFYIDGSANRNVSNKNLRLLDSRNLSLGSSDDLILSHNGTNSYISNYTGDLYIENSHDDGDIIFKSDNGSGGTTPYLTLDGSDVRINVNATNGMQFMDNIKGKFGTSGDLEIYHDGSHSRIKDVGTGHLVINATDFVVNNSGDTKNMIIATDGGSVNLYYNASQKFRTMSAGAEVTGSLILANGTTYKQTTDYLYIGGSGLDSADGAIYLGNRGDGSSYGWRFIYKGTGSGNTNNLVFQSENNGSPVDALTFNQDGYATFGQGISATNTLFSGTMNIAGGIYHIGDTNTYFGFDEGNDTFRVVTGGGERLGINNSGVRIGGGARVTTILDEDNMASDSNTALATQQSIKAYYVDNSITGSTSFRGAWDPDAGLNGGYGNPNLNTVTKQDGYYYICSDNGSATPNGTGTTPNSWHTGDWVVYNSNLGSSGEWQKIDNSSVISGTGTGGKVVKWSGSGTSETLTDSIIQDNGSGVGIGTAPAAGVELHVDGDVRVDATDGVATRKIRSSYFSSTTDIRVESGSAGDVILGDNAAARLTLASDDGATFAGTVGIGVTANSTYDLDIFKDGNASARIRGNGNATLILDSDSDNSGTAGSYLTYRDNGANKWILYKETNNDFYLYNIAANKYPIHAQAGGNILLMEDGNNLGIGAGTPAAKLDVNAGTENFVANFTSSDSIAEIRIEDSTKYTRLLTVGTQFKIMPNDGSETLILDGNDDSATFAGDVTIGALTSGQTAQLTVNNEGGVPSVARFKSRTNKAHIEISDNDTTGYVSSENNFFSLGRNAGVNANNINIDANNRVGIGTTTIQGNTKVNISGAMIQDGKTSWSDSSGLPLTTTGRVVAGLVGNSSGNGASALYIFTCYGGGGYQRIVYSIINVGGTWQCHKDIDEGQNAFDVVASTPTSGSAVTFTFKARSSSQSYTASVWIEHIGSSIDTQYVG
jgi:hypothetical protein